MATSGTVGNSFIESLKQTSTQKNEAKKGDQLGRDEFLKMLVTQLQNQDPLSPMEGEQFAVNLAQFSQLEQLIDINSKVGGGSTGGDATSLASYLGHGVILNGDSLEVENGVGGAMQIMLPNDAKEVSLELLDEQGGVVETVSLGAQSAGKHILTLPEIKAGNGEYKFKLKAETTAGSKINIGGAVAGVVSGFVPGPEPVLLVGGREVSTADIKEVHAVG